LGWRARIYPKDSKGRPTALGERRMGSHLKPEDEGPTQGSRQAPKKRKAPAPPTIEPVNRVTLVLENKPQETRVGFKKGEHEAGGFNRLHYDCSPHQ